MKKANTESNMVRTGTVEVEEVYGRAKRRQHRMLEVRKIEDRKIPKAYEVCPPEGTVVWVEMAGWPWWPARVVNRETALRKVAVDLISEFPPATATNCMVQFFNYGNGDFVDVVEVSQLIEFMHNVYVARRCGDYAVDVLEAAREALAWIGKNGIETQKKGLENMFFLEHWEYSTAFLEKVVASSPREIGNEAAEAVITNSKNKKDDACRREPMERGNRIAKRRRVVIGTDSDEDPDRIDDNAVVDTTQEKGTLQRTVSVDKSGRFIEEHIIDGEGCADSGTMQASDDCSNESNEELDLHAGAHVTIQARAAGGNVRRVHEQNDNGSGDFDVRSGRNLAGSKRPRHGNWNELKETAGTTNGSAVVAEADQRRKSRRVEESDSDGESLSESDTNMGFNDSLTELEKSIEAFGHTVNSEIARLFAITRQIRKSISHHRIRTMHETRQ